MRYLVIRTPTKEMLKREPILDVLENVTSPEDLDWRLESLEKENMDMVVVPVIDVLLALGIIESDEVETVKEGIP